MESQLHKLLKHTIAQELQKDNYKIYYEVVWSPFSRLMWHSYRPDILGVYKNENMIQIVLVECETKPNRKRVLQKTKQIKRVFSLQKQLDEHHFILPLLVIPAMNFHKINYLEIRQFWEIWIVNNKGEIIHKITRTKV